MVNNIFFKITGSLIQAYIYCPRKAWLMSRQIVGNQYNEFLAIGRLISGETYKREKKEIIISGGKIDVVRNDKGELLLIEVKKSSKFLETAKQQLLFYLFQLDKKGVKTKGEIRVPREKKIITVELDKSAKQKIEKLISNLEEILSLKKPPKEKWSRKCKNCSYLEFCWS